MGWLFWAKINLGIGAFAVFLCALSTPLDEPFLMCAGSGAGLLALLVGLVLAFRLSGWGLGAAGLGCVACLMGLLSLVPTARENVPRAQLFNNMRQIALAMHDYHDRHGHLPPAALRDKAGKPLLSWRVLLLPYLHEDRLYEKFHLDEPWDSPHNLALLPRMPSVYRRPHFPDETEKSILQVFVGPGSVFDSEGPLVKLHQISAKDGTGSTFLVVEAWEGVPWTKPEDLSCSPDQPLPRLGGARRGKERLFERNPPGSYFLAVLVDGSVRSFPKSDEKLIRAGITWNGGEEFLPP